MYVKKHLNVSNLNHRTHHNVSLSKVDTCTKTKKASILPRLKALDIEPEVVMPVTTEPLAMGPDSAPAPTNSFKLSQFIVDLSMMTLRVAHMRGSQRLKTVKRSLQ